VKKAKAFKKRMKTLQNYKFKPKHVTKTEEEIEQERYHSSLVNNALQKMRDRVIQNRIILERSYIPFDKRHLGIVDEVTFWQPLKEFGLEELLTEYEKDAICKEYTSCVQVRTISLSSLTMPREALSYRKFCSDLLPTDLRVLEDSWKPSEIKEVSDIGKYWLLSIVLPYQ
jgi:hypothetical protein